MAQVSQGAIQQESQPESQVDFTGGANGVTPMNLLKPNEVQRLSGGFAWPGGGIKSRGGYKQATYTDFGRGISIMEFTQSSGTVMTYKDIGTHWYDETMSPYYELFQQTPATFDAVYFGSREEINQVILRPTDMPITPGGTNTFDHQYWDGTNWVSYLSGLVESVANSAQMRGVPNQEWIFTIPDLHNFYIAGVKQNPPSPKQVETRQFQYWYRIICTSGGSNMGTNVIQGHQAVRGNWVGRRLILTAFKNGMSEWPGFTVPRQLIEAWTFSVNRMASAQINEYLYLASDGQRPLRRWNGCRGVTRAGASNSPVDAGLVKPTSAPSLGATNDANGYPATYILYYALSFEYGPESKLGESMPSPTATITIGGAAQRVRVTFSSAVTQAATKDVSAIWIYCTLNESTKDPVARGALPSFLRILRVERGDANWANGYYDDIATPRNVYGQRNPILYTNTPPISNPKGVVFGEGRLWIWNDTIVACSDVGQGDSWDPENTWTFPEVRGCYHVGDRLLVFEPEDISYIFGINEGLPEQKYFTRGIGLAQPYTLSQGENEIHFISNQGPARIKGGRVELTGRARAWEDVNYWNKLAPNRSIAPGVYFEGRFWFGVDNFGQSPGLVKMAVCDITANPEGAWSEVTYFDALFGTLGVIHAPLDHPLARQRILCGYRDANFDAAGSTGNPAALCVLEYGTSDNWGTNPWDGFPIRTVVNGRGMAFGRAECVKEYVHAHAKIRNVKGGPSSGANTSFRLFGSGEDTDSIRPTFDADGVQHDTEIRILTTDVGGGRHRGYGSYLQINASCDTGFRLDSWMVSAIVNPFRTD
jgi:hypothetical protein